VGGGGYLFFGLNSAREQRRINQKRKKGPEKMQKVIKRKENLGGHLFA